jgi:hypothetical protein
MQLAIQIAGLVIGVFLGIIACYVTASLLGTSFGYLGSAALKLAGIFTFPTAVSQLVPFGWLLSLILFFGLLTWLFNLDWFEALIFTFVLWGVRIGFIFGLAMLLASL